ncbi:hypothetical protein [Kitasatospora sp. NPDC001132]
MIDWLLRVNYRLSYRMRHTAHQVTRERVEQLERSLRLAGCPGPVPNAIRRALWEGAYGWRKFGWNLLRCALALLVLAGVSKGSMGLGRLAFSPAVPVVLVVVRIIDIIVVCMVFGSMLISSSPVGWFGVASRFVPINNIAGVVNACGAVLAAGPRTRPNHLTRVPMELRFAEQQILKMYRRRRTTPWRSHRWPQLRAHARLVAARLRVAEAGFDTDAESAAKELVVLLVEIADNYVAGRVGALLQEEELKELQPVRDHLAQALLSFRSMTRLIAAALVVAVFAGAGIWVASRFGVPTAIAALPAVALASVLAPALVSVVTPQPK